MSEPLRVQICGAGWATAAGPGSPSGGAPFQTAPGRLPRIRWRDILDTPNPRFGRLDDFSRAGVLAVATALQDAGMAEWGPEKRSVGIIASTRWGCLASDQEYYQTVIPEHGALASPNRFAYTLPNCFLGEAAITFGLAGPGYVINSGTPGPGDTGVLDALEVALDWLGNGCVAMLAGFCDVPPEPPTATDAPVGAGFVVLKATADRTRCRPLHLEEEAWRLGSTSIHTWADLFNTLCG